MVRRIAQPRWRGITLAVLVAAGVFTGWYARVGITGNGADGSASAQSFVSVGAGGTLVLHPFSGAGAETSQPSNISMDPDAKLELAVGSTAYHDIAYDPFVLEPAGKSADGYPLLTPFEASGATLLTVDGTPSCSTGAAACAPATVATYLVVVGEQLSPSKRAAYLAEAQAGATALAHPTASQQQVARNYATTLTQEAALPTTPPYYPEPHATAGTGMLVQTGQAPFSSLDYGIINQWFERVGTDTIIVYAGSAASDRSYGVVIVCADAPGSATGHCERAYRTPQADGPVEIVSAVGQQLTLKATDGATFVFDVPARAFLGPDGQPLPTATGAPATAAPGEATASGQAETATSLDTPTAASSEAAPSATADVAASPSPVATGGAPDLANPTVQAAIADGVPPPLLATPYPAPTATATPAAVDTPLATAAP